MKEFRSNGKKYQVKIDNSRFGKVHRLWSVEDMTQNEMVAMGINLNEGFLDIEKVHIQAEDLIIKRFF